jgi:hypothetical protein
VRKGPEECHPASESSPGGGRGGEDGVKKGEGGEGGDATSVLFDFDFDGGVDGGGVPPALPDGRLTGPPPRLASKTTMMAASAGGPAV